MIIYTNLFTAPTVDSDPNESDPESDTAYVWITTIMTKVQLCRVVPARTS